MKQARLPFTVSSPFRRIYAKIFLWFCATVLVTLLIVFAAAALTGSQPLGRRWMAVTQDLYAHSAVDFYETGGREGLTRYLEALKAGSHIEGQLLDDAGNDVLRMPVLAGTGRVLEQSQRSGLSGFQLGRVWSAASPVASGGRRYIFVMEVHPARGFMDGTYADPVFPRLILGMALVALFCLLLARHITQPIRVLEDAATKLADGALSVRASPRIGPRRDELGRMAVAFDRMAERIQDLINGQQEMLGHVSHEVRSPLTRIGVSLELLRRGEKESLEQMQLDLDRMNELIGEILEITRMDVQARQTRDEITWSVVELSGLLESIAQDAAFEAQSGEKRIVFQATGQSSVYGDQQMLRSCCENVVRNALLYTPDGTDIYITLTGESQNDTAMIVIRDEGPGVPPETVGRLFDPFYRGERERGSRPEGTGLGLAIAQRIVAMHNGTIAARNVVPHGLEIRIALPLISSSNLNDSKG